MISIKKIITVSVVITIGIIVIDQFSGSDVHANLSGSPAGRTGSPGDGNMTCMNGCHVGNTLQNTGIITSNIPAGGYVPGTTYTISATAPVSSSVNAKYGFQVSPQNNAGNLLGTLIVTNSTETQLVGSSKYITHKSAGTAPNISVGGRTWTFNWTAPAAGTGAVTFYGTFNSANGNALSTGDVISRGTLVVQEATTNSVLENENLFNCTVFPNPVADNFQVTASNVDLKVNISVSDISGRLIKEIKDCDVKQSAKIDISELTKGIYIVSIYTGKQTINKKIVKK